MLMGCWVEPHQSGRKSESGSWSIGHGSTVGADQKRRCAPPRHCELTSPPCARVGRTRRLVVRIGRITLGCDPCSTRLAMASTKSPVAKLLGDLSDALSTLGVRWYVFGAQAAVVYGSNRLTSDVDVTLELGKVSIARALKVLGTKGLVPQLPDPKFIELTRVIPLLHVPSSIPVDLVLAGPGLEEQFFDRAVTVRLGSRNVRFASPEDLIVMKVLSARSKDLEDVESILRAKGSDLNISLIQETLKTAEAMLDQSDLIRTFDQLLASSVSATTRYAAPPNVRAKQPSRKKKSKKSRSTHKI